MDALRRAATPAGDAGEEVTSPVQEPSSPMEQEDNSLSLEPLNGTSSHIEAPEEEPSEAGTSVDATNDPLPVTETPSRSEAEKHSRIKLAPRSAWTQNTLMFGSGFIFILSAVGGYYAWKSSQLPVPGQFQAATLISAPPAPVHKTATVTTPAALIKPATLPAKTVTTTTAAVTTTTRPQTRTVQSRPVPRVESPPASSIRISKKRKESSVNPRLSKAWLAYQQQDFVQAERLYKQVLQRHPDNRDAMLGLAAILSMLKF